MSVSYINNKKSIDEDFDCLETLNYEDKKTYLIEVIDRGHNGATPCLKIYEKGNPSQCLHLEFSVKDFKYFTEAIVAMHEYFGGRLEQYF